jgi:hypothetical protein
LRRHIPNARAYSSKNGKDPVRNTSMRGVSGIGMAQLKHDYVLFFTPTIAKRFVPEIGCGDRHERMVANLFKCLHCSNSIVALKLDHDSNIER